MLKSMYEKNIRDHNQKPVQIIKLKTTSTNEEE